MEKFYSALLNVWREACRHIELTESTPLITSLHQNDMTLNQVLVKLFLSRGLLKQSQSDFPGKSWNSPGVVIVQTWN